jgi:hypothetical protein
MEQPKKVQIASPGSAEDLGAMKERVAVLLGIPMNSESDSHYIQQKIEERKALPGIVKPEDVEKPITESPDQLEKLVMDAVGPVTRSEAYVETQISEANGNTLKLADLALRLGADGINVFDELIKIYCKDNLERAMRARYVMEHAKNLDLKKHAAEQYKKYSPL